MMSFCIKFIYFMYYMHLLFIHLFKIMRDISINIIKQEQLCSEKEFHVSITTIYLNSGKIRIDLSVHNHFNSLLVYKSIKHWLETTIWGYCRTQRL